MSKAYEVMKGYVEQIKAKFEKEVKEPSNSNVVSQFVNTDCIVAANYRWGEQGAEITSIHIGIENNPKDTTIHYCDITLNGNAEVMQVSAKSYEEGMSDPDNLDVDLNFDNPISLEAFFNDDRVSPYQNPDEELPFIDENEVLFDYIVKENDFIQETIHVFSDELDEIMGDGEAEETVEINKDETDAKRMLPWLEKGMNIAKSIAYDVDFAQQMARDLNFDVSGLSDKTAWKILRDKLDDISRGVEQLMEEQITANNLFVDRLDSMKESIANMDHILKTQASSIIDEQEADTAELDDDEPDIS